MNWGELTNGIQQIWDYRPGVILLIGLGFVVFLIVVLDARRHRHKHRHKHTRKY